MPIKKGDFIEVEYTGKLKTGEIFDTTDEAVAKANNLFSPQMRFGPIAICVGERNILAGLDKYIESREFGSYSFELKAEEAFGKKDPKMIQLVQTSKFLQQKIRPFPGLQINIDGVVGTVKTVTGGRTLVDFNHPLAGREVVYDIKLNKGISDKKEQVNSLVYMALGISDAGIELGNDKAVIRLRRELPDAVKDKLREDIRRLVHLKDVEFSKEAPQEKKEPEKASIK